MMRGRPRAGGGGVAGTSRTIKKMEGESEKMAGLDSSFDVNWKCNK